MSKSLNEINVHIEELQKTCNSFSHIYTSYYCIHLTFHATPVNVMGITLYYPYPEPLDNIAAQFTNVMKDKLVPDHVQLIQKQAPGQAFFSQVYIAALIGIVLSIPIIVREFIGFLKPALKEEIHVGRSITIPAIGLFITGCAFSYTAVIPFILDFLYRYGESAGLVTFFEHNGLCNICFTIFACIWNFISTAIDNVCC